MRPTLHSLLLATKRASAATLAASLCSAVLAMAAHAQPAAAQALATPSVHGSALKPGTGHAARNAHATAPGALKPVALNAAASTAPAANPAASPVAPGRQDPAIVRQAASDFLQAQSAGLPGKVTVTLGALDSRLALPACAALQPFQQPGARPWGKTSVGVRCTAPSAWTVYIQAQISVVTQYVAAATPLAQGQPIEAHQLALLEGDLANLPNGVLTSPEQAIGRNPTVSLVAGTPLRGDTLRSKAAVQQGQAVRVVSKGQGFSVSAEARAIGNAADGQIVQVRTGNGAVISGVARHGGTVEVMF